MTRILLPLAALLAGFADAFLAAGAHSLFFALLPGLAFILGYFTTWRRGLLSGSLLFLGYTFGLSLVWWGPTSPNLLYPLPYIPAFILGGFSLPAIGCMAGLVRKGTRKFALGMTLAVLTVVTGWSVYTSLPRYGYYYQVAIQSPQPLTNLELYLPMGTVSGEPYTKLYGQVVKVPGDLTENFTQAMADTERGKMLKITIPALKKDDVPVPRYTANIIFGQIGFWHESAPHQLIHLMPKSAVVGVNTVTSRQSVGPVISHESQIIETFQVPVKITASAPATVKLTMWNRTDRTEGLNFTGTFSRDYHYTERINYELLTDGEWKSVPVEARVTLDIRGISD